MIYIFINKKADYIAIRLIIALKCCRILEMDPCNLVYLYVYFCVCVWISKVLLFGNLSYEFQTEKYIENVEYTVRT